MQMEADKLVQDFKAVIRDAEELLQATKSDLTEKTLEARAKLDEVLAGARQRCRDLEGGAREKAEATGDFVREFPFETVGIAFGFGVLLGLFMNRK